MTVCATVGCDNEALFAATCSLCSMGKKPGPEEVGRASRRKTLDQVNVATPTAVFMGSLQPNDMERKAAEKIAGNSASADGSRTTVGGLSLHHITTPRVNFSIWFTRDVSGHQISVYGIGKHKGNTNTRYSVDFYDGSTKQVNL